MTDYVRRQQFLTTAAQWTVIGWMLIGIGFHWGYNQLAINVVDTPDGVLIAAGQVGPGLILGPLIGTVGILMVGISLNAINTNAIHNERTAEPVFWLVVIGLVLAASIGAAMAEIAVSVLFAVLVMIVIAASTIRL